jgi:hypothetical protein
LDRCRAEEPPLSDVGAEQQAACWLVEGGQSLPVMPASTGIVPAVTPGEELLPPSTELPDTINAKIETRADLP